MRDMHGADRPNPGEEPDDEAYTHRKNWLGQPRHGHRMLWGGVHRLIPQPHVSLNVRRPALKSITAPTQHPKLQHFGALSKKNTKQRPSLNRNDPVVGAGRVVSAQCRSSRCNKP